MVQQRPGPVGSSRGGSGTPPGNSGCAGWVIGALVLGAIVAFNQHKNTSTGSATGNEAMAADMGNAQQALVSAVEAQKPPPILALSPTAVRRGASRVRLADRESNAGEMIYSQNCYDALGRTFSWHKLDECGGFDIEAGLGLADDATAAATEVAWFETETAAGRYLKAATAAGLEATGADERLAALQRQIALRHPVKTEVFPIARPSDGEPAKASPLSPPLGNFD